MKVYLMFFQEYSWGERRTVGIFSSKEAARGYFGGRYPGGYHLVEYELDDPKSAKSMGFDW